MYKRQGYWNDWFQASLYISDKNLQTLQSMPVSYTHLDVYKRQVQQRGFTCILEQIDYACGWAFPGEDGAYTMQMLLDKADVYMYENKQLCKRRKI